MDTTEIQNLSHSIENIAHAKFWAGMKAAKAPVISAGIIPVRLDLSTGPRYLLLRAYHYWDFPKGVRNLGEDSLHAAVRELEEETSLQSPRFLWGLDYRETEPYSYGKIARYYLGRVDDGRNEPHVEIRENPMIGRAEHHEFAWFSYEKARFQLAGRVRPILDWAHDRVLSGFLPILPQSQFDNTR